MTDIAGTKMTEEPVLRQRNVDKSNNAEKEVGVTATEKASEMLETAKSFVPKIDLDAEKANISRFQKLISASTSSAPPALVPYIKKCEPVLAVTIWFFSKIIPFYVKAYEYLETFLEYVPTDLLTAILGLIVCFFGGMFPTLIAAVEAWNVAGGEMATAALKTVIDQVRRVRMANKKDDDVDADGDGIADVDQISGNDLLKRKTHLVLTSVEPKVLESAMQGVYCGWVGCLATLKLQFAKVIALGAAIGKILQKPAEIFLVPIMTRLMPSEYHPWIEVIIGTACKSIAVSIAWAIQRVISAFHSAIRGGLMASRGFMRYAKEKGFIDIDPDESWADEAAGWTLAVMGFYFQFQMSFALPWILSLVLWPFSMCEWYIVWTISS